MNLIPRLTQVLVVGAGPVGLALAAELTRRGTAVRIIDQNVGPVVHSRAVIIHARTLEIFADMGIVDAVLAAGSVIHGGTIYAENKRIIHFDLDELDSPYRFALDLPQSSTERILSEHLDSLGVEVERCTTLSGFDQDAGGVMAFLNSEDGNTETIRVDYLIGCDGAHSTVREILGPEFAGESSVENFLLADVQLNWDKPDDEWTIWFHEDGMLSVLPMPGGMSRIIADNVTGSVDRDELLRLWRLRTGVASEPRDPQWIWSLQSHYRNIQNYRSGRVFLAGDAAHVHSPAGGQGMNTGIQDAHNLAWKLALALSGTASADLLDTYTAERAPVSRAVIDLTERVTALATLRHPVSQGVRNRVFSLLTQFEIIEQRVTNRFGETAVNYRQSLLSAQSGRWYAAAPVPGDRASRVENVLRSPRFKVLAFTADSPSDELIGQIETLGRYIREGYGEHADFWTITRQPWDHSSAFVADTTGAIHQRFGAGLPCVFVIRPDNYIGFRSLGADALPVLNYMGRIFDAEPKTATV